jgi:hypothetical protein
VSRAGRRSRWARVSQIASREMSLTWETRCSRRSPFLPGPGRHPGRGQLGAARLPQEAVLESVEGRVGACSKPCRREPREWASAYTEWRSRKSCCSGDMPEQSAAVFPRRSVEGRLGDAVRMRLSCDPCSQSARDQPACKVPRPRTAHRDLHLRNRPHATLDISTDGMIISC